MFYDFVVEEGFKSQEHRIDTALKAFNEYFDANTKDWIIYAKESGMSFMYGTIIPMVTDYMLGRSLNQ